MKVERRRYAELYGPTAGDRFRLADTNLVCEVERDLTAYGEEAVFGGGKTIRDGMAQASEVTSAQRALDLVITSAVVMDPLIGIVKADIGVRAGRIVGTGKAGNPNVMDGVSPELVIGPGGAWLKVLGPDGPSVAAALSIAAAVARTEILRSLPPPSRRP